MTETHGKPCWYELGTSDLDGAGAFYEAVLGWTLADAGMEGFDYRLASIDGEMVAGMMALAGQTGAPPPNWMPYFAVDDCDALASAAGEAGGKILKEPADIPETGRFAVLADPRGAVFGVLKPLPMPDGSGGNAFDQGKVGHGHWHELMSTDPEAGFRFYAGLFGWEKSRAVDMGAMGIYQLFSHGGVDIGGMMGLGNAPAPCWLPYFGVGGVEEAVRRIGDAGGKLMHGPHEVPGGAFVAIALDPQGAVFAVVGPKTAS
jgi:uncharacterized protein